MEIVLLLLILILSTLLYYQTKLLKKSGLEREKLLKEVASLKDMLEEEKRERSELGKISFEIETLVKRREYIETDKLELEKEYKYLQERNKKLQDEILFLEEKRRVESS
jgi:cupin superfamily acireductone dioxygenase involved in methionine salvage